MTRSRTRFLVLEVIAVLQWQIECASRHQGLLHYEELEVQAGNQTPALCRGSDANAEAAIAAIENVE